MDCIKLLPDNIANQIAAGEVVQRPASVVKELLENALDAGADEIKLIVREGGTSLIQIIDNGRGMSVTDARMCWERHATSKINSAYDLFRLRSFGFRGEALASIAAIAHVEMKTKRKEDELATLIRIEGSKVIEQNPVAALNGTQFSVKNLFYNVPARRNFLKSIPVELRHIIDEFTRVAMPHHNVAFSMTHNDKDVFDLKPSTSPLRIAELLSRKNDRDFLSVSENHDLMSVRGYIGKPETARKTRGEQFLFVNNRFIRDSYLNHAIVNAYDMMIAKDQFPLYALFLEIDPSHIDVNIHPTKTEIKFDDERAIYALVKSAVRKALGQYVNIPELEFEDPNVFNPIGFTKTDNLRTHSSLDVKTDRSFNPFGELNMKSVQTRQWQQLFGNPYLDEHHETVQHEQPAETGKNPITIRFTDAFQLSNGYIAARKEDQLIIVDQRAAHERILFEKYIQNIRLRKAPVQQLLFPRTLELSSSDYALAHEIMSEMKDIGFDVADFGTNCLIINGVPAETAKGNEKELLEGLLEYYRNHAAEFAGDTRRALALALAGNEAIFRSRNMDKEEIIALLEQLFACENSSSRPNGKPIYVEIKQQNISDLFR